MTKKWIQEKNTNTKIIWRNIKNPSITVEGYLEDIGDEDYVPFWYCFTAENGKGKESSPCMRITKKEAISVIAELKNNYNELN